MWSYCNPVSIVFGDECFAELPRIIGGRRHVLVTYPDAFVKTLRQRLELMTGQPLLVIDDVAPNPDFALLGDQVARTRDLAETPEVIVALGGGSVIDTAKVIAAANGDFRIVLRFLETKAWTDGLGATPIIAVPTTAGTGSEVTCWGTVWNAAGGLKHSLALPQLYPETAVIDPTLMHSKPRGLTISTGLDALSHALESIWNKNANPISRQFAVAAAREIIDVLPRLVDDLGNGALRARMARAALYAGLAFSNTKTAIAHSISYPITLRYDVSHGIACSFTLPMIMRSLVGQDQQCSENLEAIFRRPLPEAADFLECFLEDLGVLTIPEAYRISRADMQALVAAAFDGERGQNFVGKRDSLAKHFSPEHAAPG